MSQPQQCPKCSGNMEQGFIVDDVANRAHIVASWAPGLPKKSLLGWTKVKRQEMIPVGAFRCSSCGFLEHYARAEFAAS